MGWDGCVTFFPRDPHSHHKLPQQPTQRHRAGHLTDRVRVRVTLSGDLRGDVAWVAGAVCGDSVWVAG